jgi:hypothetical protein
VGAGKFSSGKTCGITTEQAVRTNAISPNDNPRKLDLFITPYSLFSYLDER